MNKLPDSCRENVVIAGVAGVVLCLVAGGPLQATWCAGGKLHVVYTAGGNEHRCVYLAFGLAR